MPALIFSNRYFYPDESATSQLVSDLAFDLARSGHRVHVITSRQLHNDPDAALEAFEEVEGLSIYRVWTSRWGRQHLLGRFVDYLTFYCSAALALWQITRAGDVVVAKTDPPMLGTVAAVIAKFRRASVINWLQDIYPEVAEMLKLAGPAILGRSLRWFRTRTCNSAARNIVIGRCMQEQLVRAGVRAERILVIPNWVNDAVIKPLEKESNPLRDAWGLRQSFVVGYSGNFGRVHEFEALLEAARHLRSEPEIRFVLIGEGAKRSELEARAHMMGLSNVTFQPLQSMTRLAQSLTVPDVHIVTLQSKLFGLIVPSKFYGALAAGRPVIFVGPEECEIARVIRESDNGFCVSDARGRALADEILMLRDNPALCEKMGRNSRRTLEQRFSRRSALLAWHEVICQALPVQAQAQAVCDEEVTRQTIP